MIRTTALLATLLLASPALSNPVAMPTRMPAGPVSLDAFKSGSEPSQGTIQETSPASEQDSIQA